MSEMRKNQNQILADNEDVKADPTDGMNTYKEMDLELEMPEGLAFSMAMMWIVK